MPESAALLLTDVVDSTQISQALGDAALEQLWAAHDAGARELLRQWHGREIEKSDGLLAVFQRVADAVAFALAYHRLLASLTPPLTARAAIHVGTLALRESSAVDIANGARRFDVDGIAKPIAARVMALAQGGQTLLTEHARYALGATTLRTLSHGHWKLKGLPEPFELFEIGDSPSPFAALAGEAKAYQVSRVGELWQPLRQVAHSLPAERDRFVGRREPLEALATRLDRGARLVSIHGVGGSGKTRLATHFAWTKLGDYPGGAWFCDLSQAQTIEGVLFAVAHGLDISLSRTDPLVQIAHAIAGRGECLIIFDNFEQVARHAEQTLGRWLERAPLARFVVTTRELLGIVGEETLTLSTMPVQEAATLFVRRAESASQDYAPSAEDVTAIEQLVAVLDGLPLAIELAAARIRAMTPKVLLSRMNERFDVLLSRTGRLGRQATLRAAFDWSWELLLDTEKSTLAQLSVFEGGFTMQSASAVIDLHDHAPPLLMASDVVEWLVDKSLVRRVADDRFDLLESVREYAADHLRTAGRYPGSGAAAATAASARHWRYFATFDESAAASGRCIETQNLVIACRRAIDSGDAAGAVAALVSAWGALKLCGPYRVALQLIDSMTALGGLEPAHQTAIDWIAASTHILLGDARQARIDIDSGLARSQVSGDALHAARFLCARGELAGAVGDAALAKHSLGLACDAAKALGDWSLQCRAINALGALHGEQGQPDAARACYELALGVARQHRDERWEGGLMGNLATLLHGEGKLAEARALYEPALDLAIRSGDRRWEGNTRCNLGLLLYDQGHWPEARAQFEAVLVAARSMGYQRLVATALCNLGMVLEEQSEATTAEAHYADAISVAADLGERRSEGQFRGYLGRLLARRGRYLESVACFDRGEECLAEVGDEISLGLLLCQRVAAAHMCSRNDEAAAQLRRAESLAQRISAAPESEFAKALQLARSGVHLTI